MRPSRTLTIRPSRGHSAKPRVVPAFRSAAVTRVARGGGRDTTDRDHPRSGRESAPIVARIDPAFVSAGGGTKVTISLAANSRPLPLPVVYFGAARARLPAEPVVLRLGLDRTERLAGIIARPDGTAEHRFSGSIDLMSAIDALIERACQDPGPCDPERNST